MKRRTKRDITIFIGIIALVGGIAFANSQLRRSGLAEQFEALRVELEQKRVAEGIDLLKWNVIRTTKGSLRGGGNFSEELLQYDGQEVYIIGFMVPREQFRDVTEFMMLPIPIECYFCSLPPSRDVLYVNLREDEVAQIYNEPVLIKGTFNIHQGENVKFFYTLENATFKAAEDGGELTKKRLKLQHMLPPEEHEQGDDALLPGYSVEDRDQTD